MQQYLGIIFALVALLSWGFGDFFIQRTTRTVGVWKTLFYIGFLGFITLFPFVRNELTQLSFADVSLLCLAAVVAVFASLFDFEALKEGKIAIVEPLLGIELPIIVGLSITLGGEHLTLIQAVLIGIIFIGITLAITIHHTHLYYHRRLFEKGVMLAGIGAVGMGLFTFLIGFSSRTISPLLTIWVVHSLVAFVCAFYLLIVGDFKSLLSDFQKHTRSIVGQSVFDNVAWVAFALTTARIPTSIATAISEGYIALAVLLGIFINKEKLRRHQKIGVVFAIIGVVALSVVSTN